MHNFPFLQRHELLPFLYVSDFGKGTLQVVSVTPVELQCQLCLWNSSWGLHKFTKLHSFPPLQLFADFHRKSRLIAFDRFVLLCQRVFAYEYLTLLNDKWGSETMKWPPACMDRLYGTAKLSSLTLPLPQHQSWHKNPYSEKKTQSDSTPLYKQLCERWVKKTIFILWVDLWFHLGI